MRCQACDCNLTDFESSRRSTSTREFIDLCSRCFSSVSTFMDTSENFLVFDPAVDDLTTQFERVDDVAIPGEGTIEDDTVTAVDRDGQRRADGGRDEVEV